MPPRPRPPEPSVQSSPTLPPSSLPSEWTDDTLVFPNEIEQPTLPTTKPYSWATSAETTQPLEGQQALTRILQLIASIPYIPPYQTVILLLIDPATRYTLSQSLQLPHLHPR
jgi:hypothetical protein